MSDLLAGQVISYLELHEPQDLFYSTWLVLHDVVDVILRKLKSHLLENPIQSRGSNLLEVKGVPVEFLLLETPCAWVVMDVN